PWTQEPWNQKPWNAWNQNRGNLWNPRTLEPSRNLLEDHTQTGSRLDPSRVDGPSTVVTHVLSHLCRRVLHEAADTELAAEHPDHVDAAVDSDCVRRRATRGRPRECRGVERERLRVLDVGNHRLLDAEPRRPRERDHAETISERDQIRELQVDAELVARSARGSFDRSKLVQLKRMRHLRGHCCGPTFREVTHADADAEAFPEPYGEGAVDERSALYGIVHRRPARFRILELACELERIAEAVRRTLAAA